VRNFIFLIILFFSFACNSNSSKKKEMKLIPINEMRKLVWDVLKADEYYVRISVKDTIDPLQTGNLKLYDQVFKSHGITKEQFYFSYKYYESHPLQFKELIDSVESIARFQRNLILEK